jgi:hypothetical protein
MRQFDWIKLRLLIEFELSSLTELNDNFLSDSGNQ